ncbi:MAG: hypothetical protein C0504_03540 [Candidatus Solibacter sp.]|nr:hypothetical protein [Candidatus Solibacter sp.]
MSPLLPVLGVSILLLALLFFLLGRLVRTRRVFDIDLGWWKSFSPERYRPVSRLLSEADFAYAAELAGGDRKLAAEFRRRRIRLMRKYLREMSADFDRLQAVGQLMVEAGTAGRELRELLFQQRLRFTLSMWAARTQTIGFQLGISQVDVTGLVGSLDGLAAGVRQQGAAAA